MFVAVRRPQRVEVKLELSRLGDVEHPTSPNLTSSRWLLLVDPQHFDNLHGSVTQLCQ